MGHFFYGACRILREIVVGAPKVSTEHDDVGRGCVLAKYAKETFLRSES